MPVRRPILLAALALAACSGSGGTGPQPVDMPILAVGLARLDLSPVQSLTGYIAFFYDVDRDSLLTAVVRVNQRDIDQTFQAGAVPGPIYFRGSLVRADSLYQLVATIQAVEGEIDIASPNVVAPSASVVHLPATHPAGQALVVTWDPVANAQNFAVTVSNTGFRADVPAGTTSFTIPASAFTGLPTGTLVEIEVTAYNGFYVSFADIGSLDDAEETILRFTRSENITAPNNTRGTFATATTVGATFTLQ